MYVLVLCCTQPSAELHRNGERLRWDRRWRRWCWLVAAATAGDGGVSARGRGEEAKGARHGPCRRVHPPVRRRTARDLTVAADEDKPVPHMNGHTEDEAGEDDDDREGHGAGPVSASLDDGAHDWPPPPPMTTTRRGTGAGPEREEIGRRRRRSRDLDREIARDRRRSRDRTLAGAGDRSGRWISKLET